MLKKALLLANDDNYDNNSKNTYGLWDTPKTYLHLYKERPIVMDYDTPLTYFNGLTAYEVSKKGYSKHLSQQWTWFTAWINGKNNDFTKATQIKKYSPLEFGLYRTTVGDDQLKNDMFENISRRNEQPANTLDEGVSIPLINTLAMQKKIPYKYIIIGVLISLIIFLLIILFTKHHHQAKKK